MQMTQSWFLLEKLFYENKGANLREGMQRVSSLKGKEKIQRHGGLTGTQSCINITGHIVQEAHTSSV